MRRLLWLTATILLANGNPRAQDTKPVPPSHSRPVAEQPPSPRIIVVQNLAPSERKEGVAAVVPFAQGVAFDAPDLSVDDRETVWQPFGATWPDGSWRQALCLFQARVKPLAELHLPLMAGGGAKREAKPIAMPAAKLTFVVRVGNEVTRVEPKRIRDLEVNALRRVELRRARIGTSGFVAEVTITAWRDQPHAQISVAVFFSDPDLPAMMRKVDEVAIRCDGMAMVLRHPGYLGVSQATTQTGSRTVLLKGRAIGDGQGLRRVGVLVPSATGADKLTADTLRAAVVAPVLAATSWLGTEAFGPYGYVPQPPPWLRGRALRSYLARRHRTFVRREQRGGDAFGVFGHGLARMAGQTGDQGDFGTVKLTEVAWSGLPSMLLEVELSVLQEACRPVHFYERDASPVDPANHPDWVVWSGRTHWHPRVSKDRLGKPHPVGQTEYHGWTGKDRQHWSSNYLASFALLTGAHWARLELENEARIYLAAQTLDPKHTTSHSGAPRGAGRVALAAAWNLCVTDNQRLAKRMDERVDQVYFREWRGRQLAADQVRPMAVMNPDKRQLRGKHSYWNPWQDALAAVGFGAHHRMTGNQHARELAETLAVNVVRHGWLLTDNISEVAMAMRWLDGKPFTAKQWRTNDDTLVQWGFKTAFSEWSIGAVEIARVVAARTDDQALLQWATTIQDRMRQNRRKPQPNYPYLGGIDRLTEWDAVVWH